MRICAQLWGHGGDAKPYPQLIAFTQYDTKKNCDHVTSYHRAKSNNLVFTSHAFTLLDHGAIRTHKSLVPKTNALTIRPRGHVENGGNLSIYTVSMSPITEHTRNQHATIFRPPIR